MTMGVAGTAYSFPHDPKPSAIDEVGGWGDGNFKFTGFIGDWTNTLRALSRNNLRILEKMNVEFEPFTAGKAQDMKIWTTPSFAANKVAADKATWTHLKNNPGQAVPEEVGRSMYTTHTELINFVEALPKTNLTVEYAGEIPRGFPYIVLVFSMSKDRSPAGLQATKKPIVYVQGNIHGGEWSTGEGAIAFAHSLAHGKYDNLLKDVNIVMVPRVCADGAKYPIRTTADLMALQWTATPDRRDLNRDNLLLDLPVTRANKKLINAYVPHFSVDLHERGSASVQNLFGRTLDIDNGDVGMSGTTILDTPLELTRLRYEETEPVIAEVAQQHSITMGLYGEGACVYTHGSRNQFATAAQWLEDWTANGHTVVYNQGLWSADELPKLAPHAEAGYSGNMVRNAAYDADAPYYLRTDASFNTRSSRNINSLMGTVSQLFENKAGPTNVGNRGMWDRRVATGYICVLGTVTAAANKADWFVSHINAMRDRWIEKGKTVSSADMIPVLQLTPKPYYWNEGESKVGFKGHDLPYPTVDITGISEDVSIDDGVAMSSRYDTTKAMQYVGKDHPDAVVGTKGDAFKIVTDSSAPRANHTEQTAAMIKFTRNWLGYPLRERIRPYAYLVEGEYAEDLVTRMALNGIQIDRLAEDTEVEVEAWSYNQVPYVDNAQSGGGGWRNRDVRFFKKTKTFKKDDTFVIYLAQLGIHMIPMYLEPDAVYNAAACLMLPYMSLKLGGAGNQSLAPALKDMEMPVYRYMKEVNLPTYAMNVDLPLINRGGVPRFFQFPTQDETKALAEKLGKEEIRVYNFDIQVHARTDALVDGKFDMTLPTNEDTIGYMILKKDGTYVELPTQENKMLGWNVATIVVDEFGNVPFTVDVRTNGRPVVDDGSNRSLAQALPPADDLIGVQIIEVVKDKDGPTPPDPEDDDDDDSSSWSC